MKPMRDIWIPIPDPNGSERFGFRRKKYTDLNEKEKVYYETIEQIDRNSADAKAKAKQALFDLYK